MEKTSFVTFVAVAMLVVAGCTSQSVKSKGDLFLGRWEGTIGDSTGEISIVFEVVEQGGGLAGRGQVVSGAGDVEPGRTFELVPLEVEERLWFVLPLLKGSGEDLEISLRRKDNRLVGTASERDSPETAIPVTFKRS